MIKLVVGSVGRGKTKLLSELANEDIKKARGHLVYIDYKNTRMFNIDYRIRFINAGDYKVQDKESFYGFICGIVASNYDIETIYIDGLYKIVNEELEEMEDFFKKLDILDLKYNVKFVLTLNTPKDELPIFLSKYSIIEAQ